MIINQDIINDHMNTNSVEKIFIARMINQYHKNEKNSKFLSNQS